MARKCKHPRRNHYDVYGMLRGVWTVKARRCRGCDEVVPLGPANDTREVLLEILAAEVAVEFDAANGQIVVALFRAPSAMEVDPYIRSFARGWSGADDHHGFIESMDAGALARAIYDHERGEPW